MKVSTTTLAVYGELARSRTVVTKTNGAPSVTRTRNLAIIGPHSKSCPCITDYHSAGLLLTYAWKSHALAS